MNASGSNLKLSYIEETVWGETPANPDMKQLRGIVSESLGGSQESITSNELNPNRGVSYMVPGSKVVSGDLSFELGVNSAVQLLATMLGTVDTTDLLDGRYSHKITVAQGPKSLTVEKFFSDISKGFVFRGLKPNTFNLSVAPNGIATGSVAFMGKSYEGTDTQLDATPIETAHAFYNSISATVEIGGVVYEDLLSLNMDATNNLEDARAIGTQNSVGLTPGRFEVNGSFSLPLTVDKALPLIVKATDGVEDTLKMTFSNGTFSVEFLFPRVKYSGDPVPKVGGQGQVNLELSFNGLLDDNQLSDTYNKSIQITVINEQSALI